MKSKYTDRDIVRWLNRQGYVTWNRDKETGKSVFWTVPSQHIQNKSFRASCQQAMLMEFSNKLSE